MNKKGGTPVPNSVPSWAVELGTRIAEAADAVGSRNSAAKAAGVSTDMLQKYIRGENEPKLSTMTALARAAGVRVDWIATGQEPKFAEVMASGRRAETPRAGYVYLPLYDVRASAGNGHIAAHENAVDALAFKEEWVRRELRARPEDLNLIYVEGDSMEPDLRAGDIVLLDHTDTMARREGVYVIRMDGALLVKQLQRLPGGIVKVISRNPAYQPFEVALKALEEPNGFAVVGRVVWACRRF